jgi:ParB-like chromosome segregation protein Spo0J
VGFADHPISRVEWVPADALAANDYNPNVQPPPEFRLLKISLLEDGWTQPIVVFDDGSGGKPIIVDGEHRWRVAREDADVAATTDGLVPIVRIVKSRAHLMMSTIRHNRARGEHTVKQMAEIVRELLTAGESTEDVCFLLQMEVEEVERLADSSGMPTRVARDKGEFSKGWVPG